MGRIRDLARTLLAIFTTAALAVPVSAKIPERFSALAFHVWTGDDDLRSHSEAWVDLTFPSGTQKRCWLKKFDEQEKEMDALHTKLKDLHTQDEAERKTYETFLFNLNVD